MSDAQMMFYRWSPLFKDDMQAPSLLGDMPLFWAGDKRGIILVVASSAGSIFTIRSQVIYSRADINKQGDNIKAWFDGYLHASEL